MVSSFYFPANLSLNYPFQNAGNVVGRTFSSLRKRTGVHLKLNVLFCYQENNISRPCVINAKHRTIKNNARIPYSATRPKTVLWIARDAEPANCDAIFVQKNEKSLFTLLTYPFPGA
jgi:hypothetical protein